MNIDKAIFILCSMWYFYTYGPPQPIHYLFSNFYYFLFSVFNNFNKIINLDCLNLLETIDDDKNDSKESNISEEPIVIPKYEDKYLQDIRSLNKEWIFTEQENNDILDLVLRFFNQYKENKFNRIEEIQEEIRNLEIEISEDNDDLKYFETVDEEGDELLNEDNLDERNRVRKDKIKVLQEESELLISEVQTEDGLNELKKKCELEAREYIINKRIDRLENCYIIEKTPIGNVLMIYEKEKESFKYYSDCNIPYRYLEVVGRKYVKTFNCRPIFVDMEEELRLFEEKWEKEQELIKMREEDNKRILDNQKLNNDVVKKKNVFAKFKSYNKDAGGKISMAPPPKNSIPNNKSITETKENEKILLKERANRYTYEGKFANFNFLKKIDRKVFNKKLGLSFADFKKLKK